MNKEKKVEQYLKAAPKPTAPEGLLDELQRDVTLRDAGTRSTVIHRWFAPSGVSISPWRAAAAATIAIAILLPLSYGAVRAVKHFVFEDQVTFSYPKDNTTYTVKKIISTTTDGTGSDEDAKKMLEEFKELFRQGKAEEIKPGVWAATLSDGTRYAYAGRDPAGQDSVEFTEQEKEQLKKQFDEINELRKAGQFEKTYKPELDFVVDGVKHRYFEARYRLSDGTEFTMGDSEPAEKLR